MSAVAIVASVFIPIILAFVWGYACGVNAAEAVRENRHDA